VGANPRRLYLVSRLAIVAAVPDEIENLKPDRVHYEALGRGVISFSRIIL
jgi:hypothetical protein